MTLTKQIHLEALNAATIAHNKAVALLTTARDNKCADYIIETVINTIAVYAEICDDLKVKYDNA